MDDTKADRLAHEVAHAAATLKARHDALVAALAGEADPQALMRHCLDLQANHLLAAGLLQETMQYAHGLQAQRDDERTLFTRPRRTRRTPVTS